MAGPASSDGASFEQARRIRAIFGELRGRFRNGNGKPPTTFYVDLGDIPAGKWTVRVASESFEILEGKHAERFDCTLQSNPELFLRIMRREYTPGIMDLMTGSIKCSDPFKLAVLWEAFDLQS